jgi:selenide, water dikinase
MISASPIIKDLVLVGGGHAHVLVLKHLGMQSMPGVRVTLISREAHSPYSGMLPGYIAGHYNFTETHIDLGPLSRYAGARFFHDEVIGLDTVNQKLICRHRPAVSYDLLSIDIGSTPQLTLNTENNKNIIPVKPIDGFLTRWDACLHRIIARKEKTRIGVVGAGAAGVELILAIQYRLQNELQSLGRDDSTLEFHLFTDKDEILITYNSAVRARFQRVLEDRNINLHSGSRAVDVSNNLLHCDNGKTHAIDELFWATSAGAQAWVADAGLETSESGFIRVKDTLESTSHEDIFAVGDIANMINHPRPKSGVFAVRQGPPLFRNLQKKLRKQPLDDFVPQRQYLSLISTGDKNAIASRSGLTLAGPIVWKWKNWIDRRFVEKFNKLPVMEMTEQLDLTEGLASREELAELSDDGMRCGGCGGKIGAKILNEVLSQLNIRTQSDILIGMDTPDDAAIISVPEGKMLVQSVDFFRDFVDDPYLFGQIAANHALGDIFAMGADAHSALAIVTLVNGLESKLKDDLLQMMKGAIKVFDAADTYLVGGHTGEANEQSLGFTVNGVIDKDAILRKQGMQVGQRLILTKALGTGTLFAANMRYQASASWVHAAIESMIQSNQTGARCLIEHGASACTDITGFGLLGHLLEMIKSKKLNIELDIDAIPYLLGADETLARGIFSSLYAKNRQFQTSISNLETIMQHPHYPLLFDPQTAGGLLASVPEDEADKCVKALQELGYAETTIIGSVVSESNQLSPLKIFS